MDVPAEAIEMSRRLLATCLTTLGVEDRIPEISEMSIATYRYLIERLPLRVYIYTLGSLMARTEYESMLGSNRPEGAVFDAFELAFGDVRCGFYVYSLQAVADAALLGSLWRNLREEVGRPVETAALPARHLRHHTGGRTATAPDDGFPSANREGTSVGNSPIEMMPLDGDPEAIVKSLVGQRPPSQQLATYELDRSEDIMRPIFAFTMMNNEYPFEREELIDFVRRNEGILRGGGIDVLDDIKKVMDSNTEREKEFDAIMKLIDIFRRQMQLVLDDHEDEVDVRSEVIYWLIIILASQVNHGIIPLDAAVSYLKRQKYRSRLGPATLRPMLLEYSRALGTPERQEPAKLHLLLEAANLCRDPAVAIAGRGLLAASAGDPGVAGRLENACRWVNEDDLDEGDRDFVREVRARTYTEVDDADL